MEFENYKADLEPVIHLMFLDSLYCKQYGPRKSDQGSYCLLP